MRRVLVPKLAHLLVGLLVVFATATAAQAMVLSPPVDAQLTPIDDQPETDAPGLGSIIGSPAAGPDPEDAGDRGGWAQLVLAGVMAGGVVFIGSRILREVRQAS
jgi:hypothetical protein